MATVLPKFDWSKVSRNSDSPRTRTYPWDQWFDGRIWQLEPDDDFDGPAVSLEKVIRATATRLKVKVRIRITAEGNLVVQKHDGEPSRGVTKSPSLRSIKAAAAEAGVNGNGSKPKVVAPRSGRKLVKA